jgi:hypothetical protein
MMDPLAEMWVKKRIEQLEKKQLRVLVAEVRQANHEMEPLRRMAAERWRQGVRGEGFVMKPIC